MEYLNVLTAAAGGFVFGAIWYISLSKPWVKVAGIPVDENGKPKGNGSMMPFVFSAISMVIVAGFMRHIFATSGVVTPGAGFVAGLGVGLFFVTPWIVMNNGYTGRPFMLSVIDSGYAVFGCATIGLILNLF